LNWSREDRDHILKLLLILSFPNGFLRCTRDQPQLCNLHLEVAAGLGPADRTSRLRLAEFDMPTDGA